MEGFMVTAYNAKRNCLLGYQVYFPGQRYGTASEDCIRVRVGFHMRVFVFDNGSMPASSLSKCKTSLIGL